MEYMIAGVPVMALILGLVQFAKKFGVSGNNSVALSMGLDVVFGGMVYAIEENLIPAAWLPWVGIPVFALSVGLAAAGLYDLGKRLFVQE